MTTKKTPKNANNFICEKCDFICSKKSDYNRHLITRKHSLLTTNYNNDAKYTDYVCDCGKKYKHRQSLYNHKKSCQITKTNTNENTTSDNTNNYDKDLIMMLLKDNAELKQLILEVVKTTSNGVVTNNNNSNNTTNNNNHFNLNVFLNETCKNAMNISDFIDRIQVNLSDLEDTGRLGYVEGISRLFIRGLRELQVNDIGGYTPSKTPIFLKEGHRGKALLRRRTVANNHWFP
jgi:hypothetical protein